MHKSPIIPPPIPRIASAYCAKAAFNLLLSNLLDDDQHAKTLELRNCRFGDGDHDGSPVDECDVFEGCRGYD